MTAGRSGAGERVCSHRRGWLFKRLVALGATSVVLMAGSVGLDAVAASAATKGNPSMTITASGSTTVGLQVFANVNLSGGANPTGTIAYALFGPADTSCAAPIFTSTVGVTGVSMNSDRYTTTQAGTYRWQATYSGDANNNPFGPTACSNPSAAVIVSPASTGFSITAQPFTSGTLVARATIGGYGPTGSITFLLTPPGDQFCSGTPVFSSTVAVHGTGNYDSTRYTPTVTGTYKWRATYSGDTNNGMSGPTACLDNNAAVTVNSLQQPGISFNPTNMGFAAQTVATTSGAQTITTTNTGSANLAITSIAVSGSNAGDFHTSADNCTGVSVPAGGNCSLAVAFSPTAAGSRSATLTVADNAPGSPHALPLSGQGVAKTLASPQVTATASGPVTVGGAIYATAGLSGATAPSGTITVSLYATAACTGTPLYTSTLAATRNGNYQSGSYTPANAGSYRFTAAYSGDSNNNPAASACSNPGAAVTVSATPAPRATLNPQAVAFADTTTGSSSGPQPVTISNTGSAALVVSSINTGGAQAADFAVGANGCTGAQVAPSDSCTLTVTFSPGAPGDRVASLTVVDNAAGSPQTVALSGHANPDRATLVTPGDGQLGVDTVAPFTWTTIAGAQGYYLTVGTSQYGTDLVNSGILPPNQSSLAVPDLPSGRTLYATMFTEVNGTWSRFQAETFTAAVGHATLISPANGQTDVNTTAPFTWTTIAGAQGYYLTVGTSQYGTDLVNSGILPPNQSSLAVPDLPSGRTLYATMFTEVNGTWSRFQAETFTAAVGHATLISPANGQTNVNTTAPFTWTTIAGAQGYYLTVGTSQYGTDLVNSGILAPSRASYTVSALPKGKVLYATLYTEANGTWNRYQTAAFLVD